MGYSIDGRKIVYRFEMKDTGSKAAYFHPQAELQAKTI
jgi:hypothetical protein